MNKIFYIMYRLYHKKLISPRTSILSTAHGAMYNRIDSRRMNVIYISHILCKTLIMMWFRRMDHFKEKIKLLHGLRHRHMLLWFNLRNIVICLNDIANKLFENFRHSLLIFCRIRALAFQFVHHTAILPIPV